MARPNISVCTILIGSTMYILSIGFNLCGVKSHDYKKVTIVLWKSGLLIRSNGIAIIRIPGIIM